MSKKPCKWCAEGRVPENGEHWIVKGIGRIDIRKCTNPAPAEGENETYEQAPSSTPPSPKRRAASA